MTGETLTRDETSALERCELVIERGLVAFLEVAEAMIEIRDERLYRATHTTFEDYCKDRWGWGRSYVNKQIAAAEVADAIRQHTGNAGLGTMVPNEVETPLPSSERVARELAPLRDDPDKLAEAWDEAIARNGAHPTAAQTRAVVDEWNPATDILTDDEITPVSMDDLTPYQPPKPTPVPADQLGSEEIEDEVHAIVERYGAVLERLYMAVEQELDFRNQHEDELTERLWKKLKDAHDRIIAALPND